MAEPRITTNEPSHAGVLIAVARPRSAPPTTLVDVRTLTCVVVTGGAVTGAAAGDVVEGGVEGGVEPEAACDDGLKTVNHPTTATSASSATAATSHGAFDGRRDAGPGAGRVAWRVGGAA